MRQSIRHWLDWVMSEVLPHSRPRTTEQPVHLRYEKSGLILTGSMIPWNADAILIEVVARLPTTARLRNDYQLRLPGHEPVAAETIRREDEVGFRHRIIFRSPVPTDSLAGEILWKNRLLATVPITIQSPENYLASLRIHSPTVSVRVAEHSVAASVFVASTARGLTASALIRSPVGLASLADLGLHLLVSSDRGLYEQRIALSLTAAQLMAREALVSASISKFPRRAGGYSISWRVGNHELHTQRIIGISSRRFSQSLRVSDARFMTVDKAGVVRTTRNGPAAAESLQAGPVFVVVSREVGAAGLVDLSIVAQEPAVARGRTIWEGTVLISDGPTVITAGLLDVAELSRMNNFELRHQGQVLGLASLSPVPTASFTSEGGFRPPPDFGWTSAAEDELTERLNKLFGSDDRPQR